MNQRKLIGDTPHSKTSSLTPKQVRPMPHEHIELAQTPNGEIGPRCHTCGIRLTFGEAMVVDKHYHCWAHYVEVTGADTATVQIQREKRFWREWRFKGLRCPPCHEVVLFPAGQDSHTVSLNTIVLQNCGLLLGFVLENGCSFHSEVALQSDTNHFQTWTMLEGLFAKDLSILASIQQPTGKNHTSWKWLTKIG